MTSTRVDHREQCDYYRAAVALNREVHDILAGALHYPVEGPGDPGFSPERPSYVTGDHVAQSLAAEAADRIRDLEAQLDECAQPVFDPTTGPAPNHVLHSRANNLATLNGVHLDDQVCSCGQAFVANMLVRSAETLPSMARIHLDLTTHEAVTAAQQHPVMTLASIGHGDIERGTVIRDVTGTLHQFLDDHRLLGQDGIIRNTCDANRHARFEIVHRP